MARGHRLNTCIVLAAVHGLSGLFRAVSAVEPSFCRPLPTLSPSLIGHLASVDVKHQEIKPQCGNMLTGKMHDDLIPIQHLDCCNLPHSSPRQYTNTLTYVCRILLRINESFAMSIAISILCFNSRGNSFRGFRTEFSCDVLICYNVGMIAIPEPAIIDRYLYCPHCINLRSFSPICYRQVHVLSTLHQSQVVQSHLL